MDMDYIRALNDLRYVDSITQQNLMKGLQLDVERLEFYRNNCKNSYDYGIYIDKCKRNLVVLKLIELYGKTDELKLQAVNYKTRIYRVFDQEQIVVSNEFR